MFDGWTVHNTRINHVNIDTPMKYKNQNQKSKIFVVTTLGSKTEARLPATVEILYLGISL